MLPFQIDSLHRCSISVDSQTENSESENTTDDENLDIKDDGYHDAEIEVDPETDDDHDRGLGGKLSESSGSVAGDLYDHKVLSLFLLFFACMSMCKHYFEEFTLSLIPELYLAIKSKSSRYTGALFISSFQRCSKSTCSDIYYFFQLLDSSRSTLLNIG